MTARPGIVQMTFMATPTMAVLDDGLIASAHHAATAAALAAGGGGGGAGLPPPPPSATRAAALKPTDEAVSTLIRCIQLAGRCIGASPAKLADQRKLFLAVMGACLDKSENVPLLLAVYHLVAEWTLGYSLREPKPKPMEKEKEGAEEGAARRVGAR